MENQKWEYFIEIQDGYTENKNWLNELGAEGWELLSVVYTHINNKSRFYFKRLLKTI